MDLSVVIVNWNAGEDLSRAVASVRESACARPVEVIVVDNGSVDGSADGLEGGDGSVVVVRLGRNLGFAAGVNAGLDRASGRHALLLNPDAVILGEGIGRLVAWLDDHPGTGAVSPVIVDAGGAPEASVGRFPGVRSLLGRLVGGGGARPIAPPGVTTTVDWATGAVLGIGRAALARGIRLDPGYPLYFEDVDLCHRLWRAGLPVVHVAECWAAHRGGGSPAGARRRRLRRLGEARYHLRRGGVGARLLGVGYWLLAAGFWPGATRLPDRPQR